MRRRWIGVVLAAVVIAALIGGVYRWSRSDSDPSAEPPSACPIASGSASNGGVSVVGSTPMTVFYVDGDREEPTVFSVEEMVDGSIGSERAAVCAAADARVGPGRATSYWPAGVTIESVEPEFVSNDFRIRILLSSPAVRSDEVSQEQADRQVEAVVKTAQEAYGSSSVYDGELVRNPPLEVEFYVDNQRQDTVLGVDVAALDPPLN